MSYQVWQPLFCPPWLQGALGAGFEGAMGAAKDRLVDEAKLATKARFPTGAPTDALEEIGKDRLMERGRGETDANYAERLRNAWDAWQYAGSWLGLLRILHASGFAHPIGVQWNGKWAQLDVNNDLVIGQLGICFNRVPNHEGWLFDALDTFWSKFMLVVTSPTPYIYTTAAGQATLNMLVKRWKPAKATFCGTVLMGVGDLWGWPVQTWGDGGTWGPGSATLIPP